MAVVSRNAPVGVEDVYAVLQNGSLYAAWVVGTAHIRDVDDGWPSVGTRIHHSVGAWPVMLQDITQVLEADPPRRLLLRAHGWPAGAAHVEITLAPQGAGTLITIDEKPAAGPAKWVYGRWTDRLIHARNVEALSRLCDLARNQSGVTHA